MGSSRLISSESEEGSRVESISLSEVFEDMCPVYMAYGMTYDEYWYGDAWRAKYYRDSYQIQMKQRDEGFWMQGVYIYEAICDVAPILHAFSKSGTKPLPYRQKPLTYDMKIDNNMSARDKEIEEEQRKKNEQLVAQIQFDKWMKATAKQFDKNKK